MVLRGHLQGVGRVLLYTFTRLYTVENLLSDEFALVMINIDGWQMQEEMNVECVRANKTEQRKHPVEKNIISQPELILMTYDTQNLIRD